MKKFVIFAVAQLLIILIATAQPGVPASRWTNDGNAYYQIEKGEVFKITLPSQKKDSFLTKAQLTPKDSSKQILPRSIQASPDNSKVLVYTNTKKVWRYQTRGDYWMLDLATGQLKQIGKGRPESSLQFAKFSPDNKKVAYVSEHNVYVEELATGKIKKLTSDDNTQKLINGTFDWEYMMRDFSIWDNNGYELCFGQNIGGTKHV